MNQYWIPGWSIDRKVIMAELQVHLGPEAIVRPFTSRGEDGFLISTPGACLTDEQIDDICQKSQALSDQRARDRARRIHGKPLKRPLHQPVLISSAKTGRISKRSVPRSQRDRR